MFSRVLSLVFALAVAGCLTPYKKKDEADQQPLKNMAGDTSFQAFIGRLRKAVRNRDVPMVASLMTADFGYTWEQSGPPSAEVFAYWDQNNLWPVLDDLLGRKFAPNDLYLVSPPELVTDSAYAGPRCGMRIIGGSWRFAYFLPQGQQ